MAYKINKWYGNTWDDVIAARAPVGGTSEAQPGVVINSTDPPLDRYGNRISERTENILDEFNNAKVMEVFDANGKTSKISVVEGLSSGQIKVGDLGNLQAATGNEFTLIRGPQGERVLIQGAPTQTMIPTQYVGDGWKWSGHSHPDLTIPSPGDIEALKIFGQDKSVIISAKTGKTQVFTASEGGGLLSNWLPG